MNASISDEVLAYALECKRQHPEITRDELKAFLNARFIQGKDPLSAAQSFGGLGAGIACGAIYNPLSWLIGLPQIFSGLVQVINKRYKGGLSDIINGVLVIVMPDE